MNNPFRTLVIGLFLLSVAATAATAAPAATALRISKQYGINYLPLIVLEEHKLIEKNAKAAKLGEVNITWVTLGGGAAANEALLSGSVDFIALGVPPFIRLWEKTKGEAKALASFAEYPATLNSGNPNVKTLKDFTDKDKIALPAVKVSYQSLLLHIATAKEFGIKNYDKFDHLTVTARHPDAFIALTSGKSEINAHFAVEPFSQLELQHPGIHKILDGYDVLDGGASTLVLGGTYTFYKKNTALSKVVAASLEEAVNWINANKEKAAQLYIDTAKSKEPVAVFLSILNNPHNAFTTTPRKTTVLSDFLYDIKAIKTKPATWKDLFLPTAHDKQGS